LDKVMADKLSGAVPVLLTVTLCAALVLPIAVEASVSDVVERLATGALTDKPVPLSAIATGVIVPEWPMLSVPVRAPAAIGVNVTLTVQLSPVFTVVTVVPQVPPERAKSPLVLTSKVVSAYPDLWLALTVTVCSVAVPPTLVDAKVKLDVVLDPETRVARIELPDVVSGQRRGVMTP
jgi:hypothetical protein